MAVPLSRRGGGKGHAMKGRNIFFRRPLSSRGAKALMARPFRQDKPFFGGFPKHQLVLDVFPCTWFNLISHPFLQVRGDVEKISYGPFNPPPW